MIRNRGSANACIKIGVTLNKISVLHNIIYTSNIIYEFCFDNISILHVKNEYPYSFYYNLLYESSLKASWPSDSRKCRKHTKTLYFHSSWNDAVFFFWTLGGVPLWKKPLLQCRATVNETTNISLSRRSWRMMTQVILNQKIEKTWQIISINIYLQTTAENSPTLFWWSAVQCSFVQEWLLLLLFFFK